MSAMRHLLAVTILASACYGDNKISEPDALVPAMVADAQSSPMPNPATGPATWWDAYLDWGTSYCLYKERCDFYWFDTLFNSQLNDCLSWVAQQQCVKFQAVNCSLEFPKSHWKAEAQCKVDMATVDCVTTEQPESCSKAYSY